MTTQENASNAFEIWREMFQKSTEAWAQAAAGTPTNPFFSPFTGAAPGGSMPGFGQMPGFNNMPGFNPQGQFPPFFPFNDLQQVWQQFYSSWSEKFQQPMSAGTPGPEVILNAQKQWSEQLEAMAKVFAEVMGTESFASLLGRYMEQSLVLQERMVNASEPQMDSMLRAYHLPSRGQIDRMFERVIGLEDRIDDLEDENRKLRRQLEAPRRTTSSRSRSPSTAKPAESE